MSSKFAIAACLLLPLASLAAEPAAAPPAGTTPQPKADVKPAPAKTETAAPSGKSAQRPANAGGAQSDRLELDTTVVTGNRELPKVLYIVPWKKADLGDLPAQPFNTLLDEVLTPVDRDVFRREVTYYGAVNAASTAPSAPPDGTEK